MRKKTLSLLVVLTLIFGIMFNVQAAGTANSVEKNVVASTNESHILSKDEYIVNKAINSDMKNSLSGDSTTSQNRILSKDEYIVNKDSGSSIKNNSTKVALLGASDSSILGYLDGVTGTTISGWACDTSATDSPICVHIYIYDKISGNCVRGVEVEANEYRSDLAGYGYYHAFTYDWTDVPAGRYDINIYGIDENTNPLLNNCPWTYISPSYQPQVSGYFDSVTSTTISGWAWDSVTPNNPITVHIYVYDYCTDSYALGVQVQANNYRSDLENAGYGNGNHGFTYDWSDVPSGKYAIYVFAIDDMSNPMLSNCPGQYTSAPSFSSFSIGNDNMQAYNLFNTTMRNHGYRPFKEWNYTMGQIDKSNLLNYLKYSDVSFIDGHGSPSELWMCDNSSSDAAQARYNTINLDSDLGAYSSSIFSENAKWLIIQACSQLDYAVLNEPEQNSAVKWAKAMLSNGTNLRGVLGYHDRGPGDEIASEKLQRFLSIQEDDLNSDIISAWAEANERGTYRPSNWAALYHTPYEYDNLFNLVGDRSSSCGSNTVRLYSPYTQYPDLPLSATAASESKYNFAKEANINSMEQIQLSTRPFTEQQITTIQNKLLSNQNNICTVSEDKSNSGKSLQITDNGKFTYKNKNIKFTEDNSHITMTNDEAIKLAIDYLDDLGIMPKENYITKVQSLGCYQLNPVDSTQFSEPETVRMTVKFYQTYNGIPIVSDRNDGIKVDICSDGISSIEYCWSEVEGKSHKQNLLTESPQEENIFNTALANIKNNDNAQSNIVYSKLYYVDGENYTPAWIFGDGDIFTNPILINANTGEIIYSEFI